MYCPNCHSETVNNRKICQYCGYNLEQNATEYRYSQPWSSGENVWNGQEYRDYRLKLEHQQQMMLMKIVIALLCILAVIGITSWITLLYVAFK